MSKAQEEEQGKISDEAKSSTGIPPAVPTDEKKVETAPPMSPTTREILLADVDSQGEDTAIAQTGASGESSHCCECIIL